MPPQSAIYLLLLFVATIACIIVAVYSARQANVPGARPLVLLMSAAIEWLATSALEILSPSFSEKLSWLKIEYLGIATIPVAWLMFALEYADRPRTTLKNRWMLFIMPALTVALAFTNEAHHLMWLDPELANESGQPLVINGHGIWFYLNVVYSYSLVIVGIYLILSRIVRARGVYKSQAIIILIGVVVPWIGNGLYILDIVSADPTPYALAISGLSLAWAIFRYRLFDLMPIAQDAMLEGIRDGMIAIDRQSRIIAINPIAERIFEAPSAAVIGQPIGLALRGWPTTADVLDMPDEIRLHDFDYDLRISPLIGHQGTPTGHLIVLHDVTRRKQIEGQLRTQKQLFENLVAVARATSEYPTLEQTLHSILEVGKSLTSAERGSLFVLDASGLIVDAKELSDEIPPALRREVIAQQQSNGLLKWIVTHRASTIVDDTLQDKRWPQLPDEPDPIRSVLAAPIVRGSSLLGALFLLHAQPGHFTAEHAQLIGAAVDQMALALQNAQSYEAQRRMADRQTTLYEVLQAVGGQLDPDSVAHAAVEKITRLTGWQNIVIATVGVDHETLLVRAGSGAAANAVGYILESGRGVMGRAFATGRTQCLPDVSLDSDYISIDPETRSELAVLLRRGGRIRGVLNIESAQLAAFDTYDISLAESLADAVGLALDNAQLYQAIREEHSQLQAMINSSRDGIALLNLDRRFLISNARVLELLGLSGEPQDLIGRSLFDVLEGLRSIAPDAARALLEVAQRTQQDDAASGEIEIEIPPRALHWITLPVLLGGAPLGRLIVIRDITTERQLDQARDDLTRMMVHDLRNPLGAIMSAFELLTMDSSQSVSEMQRTVIDVGQQATHRMMELVNGILDVSRLERGQMPLAREPIELAALIENALQTQSVLANEKQIRLTHTVPIDLPPGNIDPELIGRVLQNLIGNALKFTPAGGAISVSASIDPANSSNLRVSISDTGPGISADIQGRLFQKFVTGNVKGRGSGLGLAFSRLAVEAHGGSIWVDSQPGKGATFFFTLPTVSSNND